MSGRSAHRRHNRRKHFRSTHTRFLCEMTNRSSVFLVCLLVLGATAVRDKQIKLEDIERDNLQSERNPNGKQHVQYVSQRSQQAAPPKMQYGFVPIKTPANYVQQQPQDYQQASVQNYQPALTQNYQQALGQNYQVLGQNYQQVLGQNYQQAQNYQAFAQNYQQPQPEQYQKQVEPQKFTQQYQQVQYVQYAQPQYTNPPSSIQYPSESFATKPQLQQYPVQYVVDNQIQQSQTQPQKFYEVPQYYYVQPNPAASTSVQSVSDDKGNVQYVMYLPSASNQGYETLLQEYTIQPEQQPQPVKYTQVQYQPEKPKYSKFQPQNKQPKSLLDSYVPSVLQYQYYKQQQENLNAIRQSQKVSAGAGKSEVVKSYRGEASRHYTRAYVPQNVKA